MFGPFPFPKLMSECGKQFLCSARLAARHVQRGCPKVRSHQFTNAAAFDYVPAQSSEHVKHSLICRAIAST